jgi:hypothetical protein
MKSRQSPHAGFLLCRILTLSLGGRRGGATARDLALKQLLKSMLNPGVHGLPIHCKDNVRRHPVCSPAHSFFLNILKMTMMVAADFSARR